MFAVKRDGAAERAPLLRSDARDSTGVCVYMYRCDALCPRNAAYMGVRSVRTSAQRARGSDDLPLCAMSAR